MKIKISLIFLLLSGFVNSQSLMDMLEAEDSNVTHYETAIFKSTRMINGHTTEMAGKKELVFTISHRFGKLNSGLYDLFGLDQSTIRFGFQYGLTDNIDIGIGRSNFEKLYDGTIKIRILRQSSGNKNMPINLSLVEGIALKSQKWTNTALDYPFNARLYYIHELLISRKFNNKLSLQLSPIVVHRNLVPEKSDQNIVPAIGIGGMYKITNRFTVVGEYYYLIPGKTADDYDNSLALGVEIETGGHVFQLNFSNSYGMTEKSFVPETIGKWKNGNVHFGFNVIRVF